MAKDGIKRRTKGFLKRLNAFSSFRDDATTLKGLKYKFSNMPRKIPGQLSLFGWDLEYVDGLSLLCSIDLLVLKGLNDFVPKHEHPVILDCGANIGISVLHYKRQFPSARITAFEPDPQIIPVLKRNLARNHASDVEVIEAAVWIKEGESAFFCEGADGSRLITIDRTVSPSVVVKTVNLANFISSGIDLIKMDIEGVESEVTVSLADKLGVVRNMVIECHIENKRIEPFARLLEALAKAGFSTSINSFGAWRDLVRQPRKLENEFDQYLMVAAWRDN